MEYNRMIAITGQSGLFELITSKKDGAIVKNLEDKSIKFVSSRIHNFSHLESIEIYTTKDNVALLDVLKAMEASGEAIPSDKDIAAIKNYLQKVYPDMDFQRVYSSDMKKIVKWYGILKANAIKLESETATEQPAVDTPVTDISSQPATASEQTTEPIAKETPKKKTATRKKAVTATENAETPTEAPKKKATRKKVTE